MRDLRVLATYPALQSESPYIRGLAFAGDVLAYGTDERCRLGDRTYEGWGLLGFTDEGVLLGTRVRDDVLEVAILENERVGLTVPTGRHALLSSDGGWLAVATLESRERTGYRVIDLATTEVVARHEPVGLLNEQLMAVSRDGMYIAVGDHMSERNGIIILPMRVRERRRWIVQRTSSLHDGAFSHDGRQFAYSTENGVTISRVPYGRHDATRMSCEDPRALAFHPRAPVIALYRRELEVWNLETQMPVARAQLGSISDLAYSFDGDSPSRTTTERSMSSRGRRDPPRRHRGSHVRGHVPARSRDRVRFPSGPSSR